MHLIRTASMLRVTIHNASCGLLTPFVIGVVLLALRSVDAESKDSPIFESDVLRKGLHSRLERELGIELHLMPQAQVCSTIQKTDGEPESGKDSQGRAVEQGPERVSGDGTNERHPGSHGPKTRI